MILRSPSQRPSPEEPPRLPLVASQRPERADALRNREAILCAARRLLRECGAEAISMERLAARAGVGKATVFRRFGDRAGLFHALLDESERRLQEAFIRGPAPLGPGAPPPERLVAFGEALLELTAERGELMLAAMPVGAGARMRSPVQAVYRAHLVALLSGCEPRLAGYFADVMLAALAPELVLAQLRGGMALPELKAGWRELAGRLVARP